ncbi:hypothetical protein C8R46DRAFT_1125491 [Mycena filopes]|nr:hypothetical protein C8R46DRAFT_1125491 [Mycena filopes]
MLDILQPARTRVADIDAQIQSLELALSVLRAERAVVAGPLEAYIYPVLTLPTEITSAIFLHLLPPYPVHPPITGSSSPIVVAHVCRDWREIALASPALWQRFLVTFEGINISEERQAELCELWARRSSSWPLSIQLKNHREHRIRSAAWGVIVAHRARWEQMLLRFDGPQMLLLPTVDGLMPLLRHLDITLPRWTTSAPLTFLEAPLLRTVIFNHSAAAVIPVPWAQITSLVLKDVFMDECTPVLEETRSLMHCELELLSDENSVSRPDISLPSLETLTLTTTAHYTSTGLLGTFTAPALRTLVVAMLLLGDDPVGELRPFVSRVTDTLQTLHVLGAVSEDELRQEFPGIDDISVQQRP